MVNIPHQHTALRRVVRGVAGLAAVGLMLTGLGAAPAQARSVRITVAPGQITEAKVGATRRTSIAEASVIVPSMTGFGFGFRFRARNAASGYLTSLGVGSDGSVTGSFSRLSGGAETRLVAATQLGLTVRAGERIRVEAAVVALRTVRLYVRAWKDGAAKPAHWQLAGSDGSKSRLTKAGATHVWATSAGTGASTPVQFDNVSVRPYSKARARAVGVAAPTVTATSSGSDTFTLGVIGDTQDEIYSSSDARFPRRTAWLAANKDKLGIKYVLQTGDLGSWAWLATNQYDNAKNAMSNLNTAGIPYTIAIGNHDTEAVGWDGVAGSSGLGGSAFAYSPMCPSKVGAANCNSNWLVRQTGPFNSYFPASSVKNVGGAYEAGKADNIWTTFTANNTKWLVLTLELWQRPAVVAWAKDVVATHPDYNVIISTHSYLDGGGTISTSNGGYGATAPSYLYDQVVSKYSNVKMVFSGHVGTTATRTDTPNGNTVVSYLGNELGQDAAFRVLTINTKTGTVTSTVYNGALTSVGTTNNSIKIIS